MASRTFGSPAVKKLQVNFQQDSGVFSKDLSLRNVQISSIMFRDHTLTTSVHGIDMVNSYVNCKIVNDQRNSRLDFLLMTLTSDIHIAGE